MSIPSEPLFSHCTTSMFTEHPAEPPIHWSYKIKEYVWHLNNVTVLLKLHEYVTGSHLRNWPFHNHFQLNTPVVKCSTNLKHSGNSAMSSISCLIKCQSLYILKQNCVVIIGKAWGIDKRSLKYYVNVTRSINTIW